MAFTATAATKPMMTCFSCSRSLKPSCFSCFYSLAHWPLCSQAPLHTAPLLTAPLFSLHSLVSRLLLEIRQAVQRCSEGQPWQIVVLAEAGNTRQGRRQAV